MSDLQSPPLPIDEALPHIQEALAATARLVIAAPPGTGKTTRLPLALLRETWLAGRRMLLLEPRRIAARLAAERMAANLGERVGETVGLSTRVDRKVSRSTRIEVVTDGLATRRLLADPELSGVGAILFDEFHERSLALDLTLALALDVQEALRPELRLIVMSATLDTARIAARIEAPAISSEGRQHPVETIYLGRSEETLEDRVARAVRRALRETSGSLLVFLPGQREIQRAADRLADVDAVIAPLYGALSPAEQDAAVAAAPNGRRKIVLSTDIAESSLTIPGVAAVIDAGLARVAYYDPEGGTRLSTERASRASVDQRRGRAGRTAPGVCYRLWSEPETRGLAAEPTPEILTADLSGLALSLAEWGARDPSHLTFVDPPPQGRMTAAIAQLTELDAIDAKGALTARGREMAALPLDPNLAALVVSAARGPDRALAAEIAALLSERGLGGADPDLGERLRRFRSDRSQRAARLRAQASRWAGAEIDAAPIENTGRILAAGLPSRIARARPNEPGSYLLASGRAGRLDANDPLSSAQWLTVAEMIGTRIRARIVAAARLSEDDAIRLGAVETTELARYDPATKTIKARRVRRMGAIVIEETPLPRPAAAAARKALVAAVQEQGVALLPAASAVRESLARILLARREFGEPWPILDDETVIRRTDEWLAPLLGDPPSFDRPTADDIRRAIAGLLDWRLARELDEIAPLALAAPSGRRLAIDYLGAEPAVEARAQEFYGIKSHPTIARGRVKLMVSLLSPAHRQIALTRDLPGFWTGGYRDMAKDMRGRYPKHDWPDDPANAKPHEGRTKARL